MVRLRNIDDCVILKPPCSTECGVINQMLPSMYRFHIDNQLSDSPRRDTYGRLGILPPAWKRDPSPHPEREWKRGIGGRGAQRSKTCTKGLNSDAVRSRLASTAWSSTWTLWLTASARTRRKISCSRTPRSQGSTRFLGARTIRSCIIRERRYRSPIMTRTES